MNLKKVKLLLFSEMSLNTRGEILHMNSSILNDKTYRRERGKSEMMTELWFAGCAGQPQLETEAAFTVSVNTVKRH